MGIKSSWLTWVGLIVLMIGCPIATSYLMQNINAASSHASTTSVVGHGSARAPAVSGPSSVPDAAVNKSTASQSTGGNPPQTASSIAWQLFKMYGAVVILFGFGIVWCCYVIRKEHKKKQNQTGKRIEPTLGDSPAGNQDDVAANRHKEHNKTVARRFDPNGPKRLRFDEIAVESAVIEKFQSLRDWFVDSATFKRFRAEILKNILLIGPSGTGKTALVRALATEAGLVAYFTSGSEFVETYVGTGAARVRSTWELLRAERDRFGKPVILFIDEVDAVARQRGSSNNTESENTLNQILVELDGGVDNEGIIVIVATNRFDLLDDAFKRDGRFDEKVMVDLPDLELRKRIFQIHLRDRPLAADIDYLFLARRCPGFSGAQIASACNKAAKAAGMRQRKLQAPLLAAAKVKIATFLTLADRKRAEKGGILHSLKKRTETSPAVTAATVELLTEITVHDVEEGIAKVEMGDEREGRAKSMTKDDMTQTAVHEACHAAVIKVKNIAPIGRITIMPRGGALGYVQASPDRDRYSKTDKDLEAQITMLLAGRIGQHMFLKTVDTGASNDFERAEELARAMVTRYGMSRKVGVIGVGAFNQARSGRQVGPQLANDIDAEVGAILHRCELEAIEILKANALSIKRVAKTLLRKETILGPEFEQLWSIAA